MRGEPDQGVIVKGLALGLAVAFNATVVGECDEDAVPAAADLTAGHQVGDAHLLSVLLAQDAKHNAVEDVVATQVAINQSAGLRRVHVSLRGNRFARCANYMRIRNENTTSVK